MYYRNYNRGSYNVSLDFNFKKPSSNQICGNNISFYYTRISAHGPSEKYIGVVIRLSLL